MNPGDQAVQRLDALFEAIRVRVREESQEHEHHPDTKPDQAPRETREKRDRRADQAAATERNRTTRALHARRVLDELVPKPPELMAEGDGSHRIGAAEDAKGTGVDKRLERRELLEDRALVGVAARGGQGVPVAFNAAARFGDGQRRRGARCHRRLPCLLRADVDDTISTKASLALRIPGPPDGRFRDDASDWNSQIGRRSALAVRPNGVPKLLRSGTRPLPLAPPFDALLAAWRELRVCLLDATTVRFDGCGKYARFTALDLGLASRATHKPTRAWEVLAMTCDHGGAFTYTKFEKRFTVARKQVSLLGLRLQALFGIDEPPYQEPWSGVYRSKFIARVGLPAEGEGKGGSDE